jgi:hypothetical protein
MSRHPSIGHRRFGYIALAIALALLASTSIVSFAPADQITGTWTVRFQDANGDRFPSRLARGLTFDQDPDGNFSFREIGPNGTTPPFPALYTNLSGQLTANLDNFEPGGIDPMLRMRAEAALGGRKIKIYTSGQPGPNFPNYPLPGTLYESIGDVVPNQNANFAATDDLPGNFNFIGGAFAAMDGLVTGMRYAEYLGARNSFIDVIYPSAAAQTFVQRSATTIVDGTPQYRMHIVDSNVFDWDVLLHEYGHTVAYGNNFDASSGGQHVVNQATNIYLAWSEGFANFYQTAAQDWENRQAGNARLPNVRERAGAASPTIRSSIDTFIDDGQDLQYSLETRKTYSTISAPITKSPEALGPRGEMAVSRILWDLLDGTGGAEGRKDEVTLGHKDTFSLMKTVVNPNSPTELQHGPTTIRELEQNCANLAGEDNVYHAQLGAIFAEHGVAPEAIRAGATATTGLAIGPPPPDFDVDPDYTVPVADKNNPFVFEFFKQRSQPQDEDQRFEKYHIQFFKEDFELSPVIPVPDDVGPTDDTVLYHDRELLFSIDMGMGDANGAAEELRQFKPTLADWQTLFNLSGGTLQDPATIWWNVVGLYPEDAGSMWGNALSFTVAVPEPATISSAILIMLGIATVRRGRTL